MVLYICIPGDYCVPGARGLGREGERERGSEAIIRVDGGGQHREAVTRPQMKRTGGRICSLRASRNTHFYS